MDTYLAIITTVLVITQIVRITQNHIQLHRQNTLFKKQMGDLADYELAKEDFEMQRDVYKMLYRELKIRESREDDLK